MSDPPAEPSDAHSAGEDAPGSRGAPLAATLDARPEIPPVAPSVGRPAQPSFADAEQLEAYKLTLARQLEAFKAETTRAIEVERETSQQQREVRRARQDALRQFLAQKWASNEHYDRLDVQIFAGLLAASAFAKETVQHPEQVAWIVILGAGTAFVVCLRNFTSYLRNLDNIGVAEKELGIVPEHAASDAGTRAEVLAKLLGTWRAAALVSYAGLLFGAATLGLGYSDAGAAARVLIFVVAAVVWFALRKFPQAKKKDG